MTVRAKGEPAFVPKVSVHLPSFVLLTSLPRNCIEDKLHAGKTVVECELPGPMYDGAEVRKVHPSPYMDFVTKPAVTPIGGLRELTSELISQFTRLKKDRALSI